jgi:hypothetical protein
MLAFAENPANQQQWAALIRRIGEETPPFAVIVAVLAEFLMPHASRARVST